MKKSSILFSGLMLLFLVGGTHQGSIYAAPAATGNEALYLPVADVMPEPVGGLPAIVKRVVYPDAARRAGVEGKVFIIAYINESGDVDDVKVVKGLQSGCDEAAVNAVKASKFSPAKQGGAAVKVQLSIPIVFKLAK